MIGQLIPTAVSNSVRTWNSSIAHEDLSAIITISVSSTRAKHDSVLFFDLMFVKLQGRTEDLRNSNRISSLAMTFITFK
jgi:hypothetical protein